MRRLLDIGLLHGDAMTVDSRTIAGIAAAASETPGQEVIRPSDRPLKPHGGVAVLRGNLAPEGCVAKLAGNDRAEHRGPARVFDGEEAAFAAVRDGVIHPGEVVVIRFEGPVGGPGMREMLAVTGAIVGAGLSDSVALVTDGRFSPTDSGARTSRRKQRSEVRSPRCATATWCISTWIRVASKWSWRTRKSTPGWRTGQRPSRHTAAACSRSTRRPSAARALAR